MMTAISTAQPAYGLEGPSAARTVDIATPQGSTYLRDNFVQSNGASSVIVARLDVGWRLEYALLNGGTPAYLRQPAQQMRKFF